ncbi:hypothetical protein BC629DRAFT_1520018 [Irpex lacteus]|nr:hypothetical protein BC629DRAFT_1520018 [Irpex lacteus]
MAPARRRVSYIIPPPSTPVPRLQLPPQGAPRNGATGPLLLPHPSADLSDDLPHSSHHTPPPPRVSCLALDTSTQILYTGGRDERERRYGVPESSEMRRTVGRLRRRRVNVNPTEIPYEEQWETDLDLFTPGKAGFLTSQFRQSVQAHTDWVNDLLLCNYNQTGEHSDDPSMYAIF